MGKTARLLGPRGTCVAALGKRAAAPAAEVGVSIVDTPETAPGKPVELAEASPAIQPPPDSENAPAASPAEAIASPDDGFGIDPATEVPQVEQARVPDEPTR